MMVPDDLKRYYRNVYSQNGEDGLLEHVLAVLGIDRGLVVEVGAWDGKKFSNTALLWRDRGWPAVLIETDLERYRELLANSVVAQDVRCVRAEVKPTGPTSLDALLGNVEVAVLSIDVDGQDRAIWEALKLRPAAVVVEVDSSLGPDVEAPTSFATMNRLAREKGYRLVDHAGNCVYVREDLAGDLPVVDERAVFSCRQWGTGHVWYRRPFLSTFLAEYRDRLLKPTGTNPVRDRAAGWDVIFRALDALPPRALTLLETGCVRPDHGDLCWGDDGCATVLLDAFARHTGSQVLSVDIDQEHVNYARGKVVSGSTRVECADSVPYLHGLPRDQVFDLVYLDSYDVDRGNPLPAQLHHLKEMAAVLKNTRPGTILAVDDADAFFDGGATGKGTYVRDFLQNIGAERLWTGYQDVWRLR